jgi:hypothetical protein
MAKHTHVSNISIFDASKVEVREEDTTANPGGGSHSIKITIHGDEGATTVITVWRGNGDAPAAPTLVVANNNHHESDGETDP